jgi:hypothetical protein
MVNVKNVEHIFVYKDPAHATNQVSIVNSQSGDILMAFNEERGPYHRDNGQSCLIRSHDGGKTWDPATKLEIWPYTDLVGNWDCALAQISDGTLLLEARVCAFFEKGIAWEGDQAHQMRFARLFGQIRTVLLKSKDDGHTWSEPYPINTRPCSQGGGSGSGHVIELPDGGLLLALGGSGPGLSGRSYTVRSDDGGDNWEYWSTIAHDPAGIIYWFEPGMSRLNDGKLICFLRSGHRPARQGKLWFTYSKNEGRTWSPAEPTNLWGYPADAIQLQDGRTLVIYGYRRPPWGVRGCVSEDGLTWDIKNEFIVRKGGAAPPTFRAYWHIGYPTCCQLDDGTILVGYHEYSKDTTPVQHLRCTRFTLDE